MKRFIGFERGMGIGGWLTNYKRFNVIPVDKRFDLTVGDFEHFRSYITESDVKNIAEMGLDHIRLGFDQIVLESSPYEYREEIFGLIESFVDWCNKYRLNVVLNLHKAIGNYCDIEESVSLLESDELQDRFIALWEAMEKRFSDRPYVAFEPLNEVRDIDGEPWNRLVKKTVDRLRKMNPTRKLIIGSARWNSPDELDKLILFDDENIIYTFHTYDPFPFTHQQGVLVASTLYYNRKMPYPGDIERYQEYEKITQNENHSYMGYKVMDKKFLEDALQGAVDFTVKHPDKILWCGEFGTIRHCKMVYRENWMRDIISI